MKNSSTNLSSLPEEESQNGQSSTHSCSKLSSVFSCKLDRPAIQVSSQKYSPLNWSDYFDEEDDIRIPDSDNVFHIYKAGNEGPVVLCLHGGGYSGLSFALSASQIKKKARVLSLDLRGHGKSSTTNDLDLSIETLCDDIVAVVKTMYGDSPPAIVMIGHSLGGALAVHISAKKVLPGLAGLVVIDVVEGTAMASLIHMQKILSNRIQHFSSIQKAIEWSIRGGSLRNIDSARVSIPGTLIYDNSRKCYTHRAKLVETEQYWRRWYEGLSEKFLSSPVPKLLLLAGTDRLDRTLTIGQMQGKFQMVVVKHTGHAIQEDVPHHFSNLILTFISRNRIGPPGISTESRRRRNSLRHTRVEAKLRGMTEQIHLDNLMNRMYHITECTQCQT